MDLMEPPEGCEISVDGAVARISSRWTPRSTSLVASLVAALIAALMGYLAAVKQVDLAAGVMVLVLVLVLVLVWSGMRSTLQAVRVSERALVLDWSIRMGFQQRRERFELEDVVSLKVRHGSELLLRTTEETRLLPIGRGDMAIWLASAIEEARDARSRREESDRREYLFEQVVPEEVERLLD